MMKRGHQRVERAQEALPQPVAPSAVPPSLPAAGSNEAIAAAQDRARPPALMPSRTEVLLTQLQETGRNNPEAWAGILRGWLTEEEPS
jgi:flagellar biosynthesis/type III secretory pathway M-ring protein FliF/YscJ